MNCVALKSSLCLTTALVGLISITLSASAVAQTEQGSAVEEVVVTGTYIRGIAPAGSESINLDSAQIVATGATSTDQLLGNVPQVSNFFNAFPIVNTGANTALQIDKPNLRNLPGINTTSGNGTLVLLDGHRIVGAGVNQDVPDPDIILPSIIDHVELATDGGSASYGADAVGGVINFVTKRNFDGAEVDAHYGHADNFNTYDASGTFGYGWGQGSAYLAYGYTAHTDLLQADRGYIRNINWSPEAVVASGGGPGFTTYVPSATQTTTGVPFPGATQGCPNASNVTGASGSTYAVLPNGTAGSKGSFNACDPRLSTFYPQESRNSLFAGVSEDFTSWIKFDLRAFFTQRIDVDNGGPQAENSSVPNTAPYYIPIAGDPGTETAAYSLASVLGNRYLSQKTEIREFGITPTLTVDVGGDWEVRAMFNFGESRSVFDNATVNTPVLNAGVAAGMINPFNLPASPALNLGSIMSEDYGQGDAGLLNERIVADGSIFTLPGGAIHGAVGIEDLRDTFRQRLSPNAFLPIGDEASLPFPSYVRDVQSAFGELQIPIFGDKFTLPFVQSLQLSMAGRYDKYSDFGVARDPKVGITYMPVDWITARANWGTSFNAPTPVDELGSKNNTILAENFFVPTPSGGSAVPQYQLSLFGSAPNLRPQTARTKSAGLEFDPPWVPGLMASVDYYHIDFVGILGQPPAFLPLIFFPNFPQDYTLNPTPAQVAAFCNQVKGGAAACAPAAGHPVFNLVNFTTQNLGNARISGFDWSIKYAHDTDFGSVDATLTANNILQDVENEGGNTVYVDQIHDAEGAGSTFHFAATVGANISWLNNLRAQATLNHSQGFSQVASASLPQTHVSSFNVVNLFFLYDFGELGFFNDSIATLNINNLFDQDPPVFKYNGALAAGSANGGGGYANGETLGREIEIGLKEKF